MAFEFPSLHEFGLRESAELLTRGFSDYFVPIAYTAETFLHMARVDSLDLTASRIAVRDGRAVGTALIARRGWTSRLTGMAFPPDARRLGAGRAMMERLLGEAKERGDREMVLEVIEQNEPAVRLYEAMGFRKVRRLVGFAGHMADEEGASEVASMMGVPEQVDLREMAAVVIREGVSDLPWQLSGETLAQLNPPVVAFHLEGAWAALINLDSPTVTIRSLVTMRGWRGKGRAFALLRVLQARYPGKEWQASPVWPEEMSGVFVRAGLARVAISQWQMTRTIANG